LEGRLELLNQFTVESILVFWPVHDEVGYYSLLPFPYTVQFDQHTPLMITFIIPIDIGGGREGGGGGGGDVDGLLAPWAATTKQTIACTPIRSNCGTTTTTTTTQCDSPQDQRCPHDGWSAVENAHVTGFVTTCMEYGGKQMNSGNNVVMMMTCLRSSIREGVMGDE